MLVKLDHFPRDRDEHKEYLKPPPPPSIHTFGQPRFGHQKNLLLSLKRWTTYTPQNKQFAPGRGQLILKKTQWFRCDLLVSGRAMENKPQEYPSSNDMMGRSLEIGGVWVGGTLQTEPFLKQQPFERQMRNLGIPQPQ